MSELTYEIAMDGYPRLTVAQLEKVVSLRKAYVRKRDDVLQGVVECWAQKYIDEDTKARNEALRQLDNYLSDVWGSLVRSAYAGRMP